MQAVNYFQIYTTIIIHESLFNITLYINTQFQYYQSIDQTIVIYNTSFQGRVINVRVLSFILFYCISATQ